MKKDGAWLLCGNKMATRCNRDFYCRSYCLLNMFRAPLCPSSRLKSIIQWLLPVVFRAVVFKLLVWCGAEGYEPYPMALGIFLSSYDTVFSCCVIVN